MELILLLTLTKAYVQLVNMSLNNNSKNKIEKRINKKRLLTRQDLMKKKLSLCLIIYSGQFSLRLSIPKKIKMA